MANCPTAKNPRASIEEPLNKHVTSSVTKHPPCFRSVEETASICHNGSPNLDDMLVEKHKTLNVDEKIQQLNIKEWGMLKVVLNLPISRIVNGLRMSRSGIGFQKSRTNICQSMLKRKNWHCCLEYSWCSKMVSVLQYRYSVTEVVGFFYCCPD